MKVRGGGGLATRTILQKTQKRSVFESRGVTDLKLSPDWDSGHNLQNFEMEEGHME